MRRDRLQLHSERVAWAYLAREGGFCKSKSRKGYLLNLLIDLDKIDTVINWRMLIYLGDLLEPAGMSALPRSDLEMDQNPVGLQGLGILKKDVKSITQSV